MTILFTYPGYEQIANNLIKALNYQKGEAIFYSFPEGESLVSIKSDVKNKEVILFCGLDDANIKIMPIMFFADLAREFGAKKIGLIAPYLGYMRQDKRFNEGEAITSKIFAKFLSKQIDWLITIDPHLHRHKSLAEIYSIPATALHSIDVIAKWIKENVKMPILIGPDSESEQWVANTANKIDVPFIILNKTRYSERKVKIPIPKSQIDKYKNHTPIIIDDIISTGGTMIETAKNLQKLAMQPPIPIAIHALFVDDAYEKLQEHCQKIITCNTVSHFSNEIDISAVIIDALKANSI